MSKEIFTRLLHRFSHVDIPIVYNVNRVDESSYSKRALLVYLITPFRIEDNDPLYLFHQNLRRCKHIAAILHELGYIVDVVDGRYQSFKATGDYDLILSDRAEITSTRNGIKEDAIKIFIATTDYHGKHNRSLRRRHDLLFGRRKYELPIRRVYSEDVPFVMNSDAIIGVGNQLSVGSWKEVFNGPIYSYNNCGYREIRGPSESKDFEFAKQRFLFFASASQMQKGLDLLLEIFPQHPDLHLYVCSLFKMEKDFCDCYYKELYETPNIHPIGWVQVNSPQFYFLIDRCAYVILPTCSEGQPGSVVHCMQAGLIPIVTAEAGIDTEDFGIKLSGDDIEVIESTVIELSQLPGDWHKEKSIITNKAAQEKYCDQALIATWRNVLSQYNYPKVLRTVVNSEVNGGR